MALLKNLLAGLRGLFRKEQVEREMDEELKGYLDAATRDKMRAGTSRQQAARAARIEMGGMEAVKESVRAVSWESRVETIWTDLRFGARLLRLNPLFAAAAILSLALGIGANTAIFQLIDAVRMRTLPVKNAQEIARVAIDHRGSASGHFSTRYPDLTYAMWEQIGSQQQGFSGIFAWAPATFNIAPGGEVRTVQGLWVSGDFFETLGIQPALGRLLSAADDQPGCGSAGAAISYAFWQREFGGERSVLTRSITVNRHPVPIIGVAPADFYGVEVGRSFDVAVPLCAEPVVNGEDSQLQSRIGWWLSVMGRLKPGWTMERAAAQLRAISPGIFEATLPPQLSAPNAKHFLQYKLAAFPGDSGVSEVRKDYEKPLWLLLALAALVLLIASANLANLMLARASAREKEMAMRMAVGAGRARLIRQLLVESLLLAVIGAALGAMLARNLSHVLVASLSTQNDPLFVDLGTDWRVLGFTSALAVLTCILFGLAPALRATSVAPGLALKESGRGATQGRRSRFALRRILVVSQIALSLTLLVGALLFAHSLNNLAGVNAGFHQDGILVTDIDFTSFNLPKESRTDFSNTLLKRVRGLPGVESAATTAVVPLSGDGIGHDILLRAGAESDDDVPVANFNVVSPGFFETLQTRFLAGRDFDDHDTAASPQVAIVNEAFAKKFANGANAVGMKFRVRTLRKITPYEVIGLVQDTKYAELREDFQPIVYTAAAQSDRPGTDALILIRSRASLAGLIAAVKADASEVNPNMDITFSTLRKTIDNGLLRDRLMARLSGFFGFLAVLLAVIGLYGVISYTVARRRNEIAIRVALGAGRENIVRLVMQEAGALLGVGLVIGMMLALAGGKAAASMLFGLKAWDAATFALALLLQAFVAVLASLLPAARAARSDPMDALRQE
jgi:putative ABC transport system permease protein